MFCAFQIALCDAIFSITQNVALSSDIVSEAEKWVALLMFLIANSANSITVSDALGKCSS